VEEPERYAPFVDFCCGKRGEAEHEVNRTVRRLYAGTTEEQQLAVVLEEASGKRFDGLARLIGVCGVGARRLPEVQRVPGLEATAAGAYIVAIGTDLDYHGHVFQDQVTRPGNAFSKVCLRRSKRSSVQRCPMSGRKCSPITVRVVGCSTNTASTISESAQVNATYFGLRASNRHSGARRFGLRSTRPLVCGKTSSLGRSALIGVAAGARHQFMLAARADRWRAAR
jgi:hypothetical protein